MMHYVPGTSFTTEEFRFIVECIHKKFDELKNKSTDKNQQDLFDKHNNTIYQKLYSLTDHD